MSLVSRCVVLSIAALLPLCGWSAARADATPPLYIDYEGGFTGVVIEGDVWPPDATVRLCDANPCAPFTNNYGTVSSDDFGHIGAQFLPQSQSSPPEGVSPIAAGMTLYGVITSMFGNVSSATVVVTDTQYRLTEVYVDPGIDFTFDSNIPTNLPEVGFVPGTVELIATSPNVSIISETTSYDPSTNSLTTNGAFDFSPGPVVFTYQATGGFPLTQDPATGDPLSGVQVSDWQVRIGTVVPEPGSWAMMLCGLGGMGAALRALRGRETRRSLIDQTSR